MDTVLTAERVERAEQAREVVSGVVCELKGGEWCRLRIVIGRHGYMRRKRRGGRGVDCILIWSEFL